MMLAVFPKDGHHVRDDGMIMLSRHAAKFYEI